MLNLSSKFVLKALPVLAVTALLAACNTTGAKEDYSANLSAKTFTNETSPSSNGYAENNPGAANALPSPRAAAKN